MALAELGLLGKRLVALEGRHDAAAKKLMVDHQALAGPFEARRAQLEAALERFCAQHGPQLERRNGRGRRSRRLLFGRLGYRSSQAVVVRDEERARRRLAGWRTGRRFLRLRAEVDREALRRYLATAGGSRAATVRRLRRAGIELRRGENWFYEINAAALGRWAEP